MESDRRDTCPHWHDTRAQVEPPERTTRVAVQAGSWAKATASTWARLHCQLPICAGVAAAGGPAVVVDAVVLKPGLPTSVQRESGHSGWPHPRDTATRAQTPMSDLVCIHHSQKLSPTTCLPRLHAWPGPWRAPHQVSSHTDIPDESASCTKTCARWLCMLGIDVCRMVASAT